MKIKQIKKFRKELKKMGAKKIAPISIKDKSEEIALKIGELGLMESINPVRMIMERQEFVYEWVVTKPFINVADNKGFKFLIKYIRKELKTLITPV